MVAALISTILSPAKRFDAPGVGHEQLNRLGLHVGRMLLARACASVRRWQVADRSSEDAETLVRDGCVAIPGFLEPAAFAALHREVTARIDAVANEVPLPESRERGFGSVRRHDWGIDRFDGGTLNRLISPGEETPLTGAIAAHPTISRLSRAVVGRRFTVDKLAIYQTVHGDNRTNRDLQTKLHRDTFHDAMKFWLFLEPVGPEDGPFVYVPTSHRLTRERRRWERRNALAAIQRGRAGSEGAGGAFRLPKRELPLLSLPQPVEMTVASNTLIVANVLGFHRRGDARPGARRLAIYGNLRPHPFGLTGS